MGYQESLVTTNNEKDFNKLVNMIKTCGKDYYEFYCCLPNLIITLKQNIRIPKDMQEWAGIKVIKAGTRLIHFSGERQIQRKVTRLLNVKNEEYDASFQIFNEFSKDSFSISVLDFEVHIIFMEYLPHEKLFPMWGHSIKDEIGMETEFVSIEEFKF